MKKILCIIGVAFVLVGCGNNHIKTTCELDDDDEKKVLDITYTEDKILVSFVLTSTYKVDEKALNTKDVEEVLKANLPKDVSGIKTDITYDKKTKKATQTIEVSVDDLEEQDYVTFGIPQNKSSVKFINDQKQAKYVCKD